MYSEYGINHTKRSNERMKAQVHPNNTQKLSSCFTVNIMRLQPVSLVQKYNYFLFLKLQKHINIVCKQTAELPTVTPGGTCSYHFCTKCQRFQRILTGFLQSQQCNYYSTCVSQANLTSGSHSCQITSWQQRSQSLD